ncbi:MAG: HupE/UreJ family protein [Flavobacteriales bacterium]|nr:HupE/UreJ family protein [Flavobacteriales bacterium]
MFPTYLQLGFEHITDLTGYDHMLFLLALCAAYVYSDWKKILVLVTAFTLGHSITLALAVLNIIPVNAAWVEFLIPVTIAATAAKNLLSFKVAPSFAESSSPFREPEKAQTAILDLTYLMALTFGLIHGMGFSNYLRSLLGDELLMPLFAFNVGLELGQLLVVALIFGLQFVLMNTIRVKPKHWNLIVSLTAGAISLLLAAQRIPF